MLPFMRPARPRARGSGAGQEIGSSAGRRVRRGLWSPSDDTAPTRGARHRPVREQGRVAPRRSPLAAACTRRRGVAGSTSSASHGNTWCSVREPEHFSCEMFRNAIRNRTEASDSRSENHSTRPPDRVPFRQSDVLQYPESGRYPLHDAILSGPGRLSYPHVVTYPPMNPRLRAAPRHAMWRPPCADSLKFLHLPAPNHRCLGPMRVWNTRCYISRPSATCVQ